MPCIKFKFVFSCRNSNFLNVHKYIMKIMVSFFNRITSHPSHYNIFCIIALLPAAISPASAALVAAVIILEVVNRIGGRLRTTICNRLQLACLRVNVPMIEERTLLHGHMTMIAVQELLTPEWMRIQTYGIAWAYRIGAGQRGDVALSTIA